MQKDVILVEKNSYKSIERNKKQRIEENKLIE